MTLFLTGPSAGYFDDNRNGFATVAGTLRGQGLIVINPREIAEHYSDPRAIFRSLLDSEVVGVMPGWEEDAEASLIVGIARQIGLSVVQVPSLESL